MKKLILFNFGLGLFLLTYYFNHNNNKPVNENYQVYMQTQQSAQDFYRKQCGFCHTQEELIAPDMNKIKAMYLKKYPDKEAFVQAIVKFVENPNKKDAIYKDGIENFMDMPKMPFKKEQIKGVASYIYNNNNL